jgi:hypothetical protein
MIDQVMSPFFVEDRNVPVWRYLRFGGFISALRARKLRLTLLETYAMPDEKTGFASDPYEASVPESVKQSDCQIINQMDPMGDEEPLTVFDEDNSPHRRMASVEFRRRNVLKAVYVSCWRQGKESEAMWHLYCPEKPDMGVNETGIALLSTYSKLERSICRPGTMVSPIEYIDYQNGQFARHSHPYDQALHKRDAFIHEQEVRVLHFNAEQYGRACAEPNFVAPPDDQIAWDASEVLDKIVLSPRCSQERLAEVRAAVHEVAPALAQKVVLSSLAEPPRY